MNLKRLILFVALAAGIVACERGRPEALKRAESGGFAVQEAKDQISALGYMAGGALKRAQAPASNAAVPAPTMAPQLQSLLKLIRTASMQIEVKDFKTAVDEIGRAALAMGGYVSDRQSNEGASGHTQGQVTIRVPSQRFEGALSALRGLGNVKNEGVQTQDVTKAYADLETRLKVKRETATRLREILIRQTGKVSEVLEVEREIGRVVEEIEQAEGERRYYDNLVSLSTITVSLFEPDSIVTRGALDPVFHALRNSLHRMSESTAALIDIAAAFIPWLISLYLLWKVGRKIAGPRRPRT